MSESSFVNLNQQQQAASFPHYEIEPFDAADLLRHGVDATKCKWLEVTITELKGLLLSHATTEAESCKSFKPFLEVSPMSLAQEILGGADDGPSSRVHLQAGLGIFTFDFRGSKLHLVHQRRGPVVGTNCGPALHTSLVLFCEDGGQVGVDGPAEVITKLCGKLVADNATNTGAAEFTIRRWNCEMLSIPSLPFPSLSIASSIATHTHSLNKPLIFSSFLPLLSPFSQFSFAFPSPSPCFPPTPPRPLPSPPFC